MENNVFELFEKYNEETEDRVASGIEANRKGFATITLKDKDGNPVDGEIKAIQKNHEFRFGANCFMLGQLETEEKNRLYEQYFADLFNMATLPFYWDSTEPERGHLRYAKDSTPLYRRPPIDACLEFCEKHGIEPREHALAYDHFFPQWLWDKPVEECKREYERRCREISERYADKIRTIEVTNETWWWTERTALFNEPDFVEYCFRTARKYFPANQLGINEQSDLWREGDRVNERYFMQIERELKKGTPIDAIGMQYHMFFRREDEYARTRRQYNPKHLFGVLDLYGTLGKPLQITEVTIPCYTDEAADEEKQAEILRRLYSIWFSHEKMEQIIYWNTVDGYAHAAEPGDMSAGENYYRGGLIRFDFTKKPSYEMLKKLIHEEWHTETGAVSKNGVAKFKGFYGDYDLIVKTASGEIKKTIHLGKKCKNEFEIII